LIPLGLITALWGLGPGITSALVTFLAFNYFFISPFYTFTVHRPTDVVILVVFLIVAIVISQLVGAQQFAAATSRNASTQLYELSIAGERTATTRLHKSLQNRCRPFHKVVCRTQNYGWNLLRLLT
jgi:K+-sensing histidine kinase KdpD